MTNFTRPSSTYQQLLKSSNYLMPGIKAFLAVFLISTFIFSGTVSAQTVSNSKLSCIVPAGAQDPCTSKDLSVVGLFVDAPPCATCTPGDPVTYTLKMTVNNGTKSVRTAFALYGTLSPGATITFGGSSYSGNIFICTGDITVKSDELLPGETALGNQTFTVGTISFTCGQELTLTNNKLAWTDASGTTSDRCNTFSQATTCADIAPKCGQAASITIKQPVVPPTLSGANPTCLVNTGSITLTPTTGSTYSFDGQAYAAYPSGGWTGLAAGSTHTVAEKNSDGCNSPNASRTIGNTLPVPVAPTLGGADPTCTVNTGSITLTPTTGSTYSFDGQAYAAYPSGGWTGLAAGSTHTVAEKNSAGCNSPNASRTIGSAKSAPAAPTLAGADPTCILATGSITLTPVSGFLYSFDGGTYAAYPSGGWTGLTAGSSHTVSAQNADGCNSPNASRTIGSAKSAPAAPTLAGADPTCILATGSITLTPVSGFLYSFDGGTYAAYPSGGWTGLTAGSSHTVSAQNADGCNSPNASRTIGNAKSAPAAPTLAGADPTCILATGSITLTPVSGFLYSFDGGTYAAYPSGGWTGLTAGSSHTVSAQNADGCNSPNASRTIGSAKSAPAAPTLAGADPTCILATGSITLTPVSGFLYSFDGGTYAAYPSGGWTGLTAGSSHTVSAQNEDGCNSPNASRTIGSAKSAPAAPTLAGADPTCILATGSITLTPVSGFLYSFDGGTYAAYPSGGWTGLTAGSTHTVSAQNADGCNSPNASRTIGSAKSAPAAPTLAGADPTCILATGSITLTPVSGFLYSFDGGTYAAYPSGGWTGLTAGSSHTVSAQNADGCNSPNASRTIGSAKSAPAAPTLAGADPTCILATGSITLTPVSGFLYSFDGGTYAAYPSGGWTGLTAGSSHTVSAQNADGCNSPNASRTIGSAKSAPAAPTLAGADPTCILATGSITLTPVSGFLYSFDGGTYAAYPSGGWTGLTAGSSHTVSAQNADGCNSPNASRTIGNAPTNCFNITYCSYTQGFWGNKNGFIMLPRLLMTPLVIGLPGPTTITIPVGAAKALNNMMPGGGTPSALLSGSCNIGTGNGPGTCGLYVTKQGRFDNVLLSQTITLALNTRVTQSLLSLAIQSGYITTSAGGCRSLPTSVVTYLTKTGKATVSGLLELANAVLGGSLKAGVGDVPSLSAINDAVTTINEVFDECKTFTGYQTSCPSNTFITSVTTGEVSNAVTLPSKLSVSAYPNPYQDKVKFVITSPVSGQGSLDVYNLLGQKVKTVFSGSVQAGLQRTVEYAVPNANRTPLMYIFRVGDHKISGKLLH